MSLKRRSTIEMNGIPVRGELMEDRATPIVTTRETGKDHSYKLFFAGTQTRQATWDSSLTVEPG